jgi:hypothetical protein
MKHSVYAAAITALTLVTTPSLSTAREITVGGECPSGQSAGSQTRGRTVTLDPGCQQPPSLTPQQLAAYKQATAGAAPKPPGFWAPKSTAPSVK